jgi:hypothetical protein
MLFLNATRLVAAALTLVGVMAHMPDLTAEETAWYNAHVARSSEALKQCLQTPELKDLHKRMTIERIETLKRVRNARGLDTRGKYKNFV